MSVRVAGPADAEEVARLLDAFRAWYDRDAPVYEEFLERVRVVMGTERAEYLIAPGGVAQLRFRFSVWTGTDDCWLEDLFVEEAARGTGVGRALVDAALERARARGCTRVELDVDEGNAAARSLYEAAGFASSKRPGERVFFMQRYL